MFVGTRKAILTGRDPCLEEVGARVVGGFVAGGVVGQIVLLVVVIGREHGEALLQWLHYGF